MFGQKTHSIIVRCFIDFRCEWVTMHSEIMNAWNIARDDTEIAGVAAAGLKAVDQVSGPCKGGTSSVTRLAARSPCDYDPRPGSICRGEKEGDGKPRGVMIRLIANVSSSALPNPTIKEPALSFWKIEVRVKRIV